MSVPIIQTVKGRVVFFFAKGAKESPLLRYYPYGHAITGAGDQAIVEIAKTQLGNVGDQPYWSWCGFNGHVQWCLLVVAQ